MVLFCAPYFLVKGGLTAKSNQTSQDRLKQSKYCNLAKNNLGSSLLVQWGLAYWPNRIGFLFGYSALGDHSECLTCNLIRQILKCGSRLGPVNLNHTWPLTGLSPRKEYWIISRVEYSGGPMSYHTLMHRQIKCYYIQVAAACENSWAHQYMWYKYMFLLPPFPVGGVICM